MKNVIIIAEAGVNHNGDIELAKKLIDAAADAGADYVKFQSFRAEKIASKQAAKASYQLQATTAEESQVQMLKKLELSEEQHRLLLTYCTQRGIRFLSTPFDVESIHLLRSLGVQLGKIPSGEITNLPYLQAMAKSFPELVMSTGMCTEADVSNAIRVIEATGFLKDKLIVLHCNTEYPTPFADVNLRAMPALGKTLGVRVGYSDHTLGIAIPVAAVAMGAVLIEKHFTLDRNMEGPDHKASLEPPELAAMVQAIRETALALGSAEKKPSPSEQKNMAIARKSIVASRAIRKGELFTDDNLTTKRPGTGISPMRWNEVLGKVSSRDFEEDDLIEL